MVDVLQQADSPKEILDLVDNNDVIIGTITRKEVYAKGLVNFRCVHAFIKNSEGKLWIPRRVATKKLKPLALDFSIAGHVSSGETYQEALIKEAREEVNLDLTVIPFKEIGYFSPHTDGVRVWQRVYEILSDETPVYNPEDFCEASWLLPAEILERQAGGEDMKDDIPLILRRCYIER